MSFSVFAFYMIFGGDKIGYDAGGGSAENVTVQGYENFNNVLNNFIENLNKTISI
jgi:hypothetical protein